MNFAPAVQAAGSPCDAGKAIGCDIQPYQEVGEALESVAVTLADGVVEENELKATIPKLEGDIQECASLKYVLEELCKRRKKKTKS